MNYYISPTGNDANNGTSEATAWVTLDRLQTFLSGSPGLEPGDIVYFERGGRWFNILEIPTQNDGIEGNTVKLQSYGTGETPIISGFKTITGWVDQGNNIWKRTDVSYPDYISLLLIDGTIRPKT